MPAGKQPSGPKSRTAQAVPASKEQRARLACEVHDSRQYQRGVSSLFAFSGEPPNFSPVRRNASPVLRPTLPIA